MLTVEPAPGAVRSHPLAGMFFLVLGIGLVAAGMFGSWSLGPFAKLGPASIVVPFVFWQLAVWSILFGVFFLRPRGRHAPPKKRGRIAL